MKRRFEEVAIVQRQGRTVARIKDTRAGRDLWIHRMGERLYHWDRLDSPVSVPLLRVAANMALDRYAEEAGEVRGAIGPVRKCRKCDRGFRPASKNSRATLCKDCRSQVSVRNAKARYEGAAA